MLRWASRIRIILIAILATAGLPSAGSFAATACSVTITPGSVTPASMTTFTVSVTNTGSADLSWVDIAVPSAHLTYNGNYIYDWAGADRADGTTLTGNTIGQGQTANFSILATAGVVPAAVNKWQVQTSDDPNGAAPTACGGEPNTVVAGHPPNSSVNGVSNIFVSGITATSATVSWDSDNATTGIVYYGSSSNYGAVSAYNSNLDTSHSITMSGLNSAASYHFQVAGDDTQGGFAYSGDNTLTTLAAPKPQTSPPPDSNAAPSKTIPTEHVPPTVTITTNLSKPVKSVPVISGAAADNQAVALVEYSTDGGRNWLPVQAAKGIGSKKVTFAFTPTLTQDGNYSIEARATDTSGNTASTSAQTLIIDRLPPQMGEAVISFGPEIIAPSSGGNIRLVANAAYRFTTHAIGGAISAVVSARIHGGQSSVQTFGLAQSADGLWSGTINLRAEGYYDLVVASQDGAGNRTERVLETASVMPPGRLFGRGQQLAGHATLTVYYLEPHSRTWTVWDGAPYGQTNPQRANNGVYTMMVPAGDYYLDASAPGYGRLITRRFSVTSPTDLSTDLTLPPAFSWKLGPLNLTIPSFQVATMTFRGNSLDTAPPAPPAALPAFALSSLDGVTVHSVELNGYPTVVTLVDTWSPSSTDQLPVLARVQRNQDVRTVPIFIQESPAQAKAYLAVAGYQLSGLTDPDGTLVAALGAGAGPKHFFLDRSGHIKKVMVGVLSEQTILTQLGSF